VALMTYEDVTPYPHIFLIASLSVILLVGLSPRAIACEKAVGQAEKKMNLERSLITLGITQIRTVLSANENEEGDSLWTPGAAPGESSVLLSLRGEDLSKTPGLGNERQALSPLGCGVFHLEIDDRNWQRMKLSQGTQSMENPRMFFVSLDSSSGRTKSNAGYTLNGEDQKAIGERGEEEEEDSASLRDWKGIGRDATFYLSYQGVFGGILYLLPESVTGWSKEQKQSSLRKWGKNVQQPTWDTDKWWINYIGHPYWGAIFYIRARERGFSAFDSFLYSALLSSLFEFGIEAFFERPSYQDLVATPIGGTLLGAFVFEPVRESIKAKEELKWYDHLTLFVTDPLGAVNSVLERVLGMESDVRVQSQFGPQFLLQQDHSPHSEARSMKGQAETFPSHRKASIALTCKW